MACVVASSAAVAPSALAAATPSSAVQTSSIQSFTGLKSAGVFAAKSVSLSSKAVSNGSRVQCMQVWTPINNPKFETLSYLPALTPTKIAKEIDYMLANKWVPCLEFDPVGVISRKHHKSPGYYDGRYWTMWKLPMFGCTDSAPVLREIELVKKEYPNCYIRVLGFDNVRQVQCSAFIVHKPAARPPTQPGGQVRPRQGPAPVSAPKLLQLPQLSQISQISGPVFRPPASSSFPGEALDWDALTAVGKAVERLVSPGTPHPSSLREQRWRRMQAAASELTGLSGAIAAHSVAHELFIQELEDLIELLSRASTRR